MQNTQKKKSPTFSEYNGAFTLSSLSEMKR